MLAGKEYQMDIEVSKNGFKFAVYKISDVQTNYISNISNSINRSTLYYLFLIVYLSFLTFSCIKSLIHNNLLNTIKLHIR